MVKQINANGDERIDHDEFVNFFATLLMGQRKQKQLIAFRFYDIEYDEVISEEEVKIVLKHIPIYLCSRQGVSFDLEDNEFHGPSIANNL